METRQGPFSTLFVLLSLWLAAIRDMAIVGQQIQAYDICQARTGKHVSRLQQTVWTMHSKVHIRASDEAMAVDGEPCCVANLERLVLKSLRLRFIHWLCAVGKAEPARIGYRDLAGISLQKGQG